MSGEQQGQVGDGEIANILFWIGVPLAFGLGMWTSYVLMQQTGSNASSALQDARREIRELRGGRVRLEKRLRATRNELSSVRSKLAEAKERIEQQDADRDQEGKRRAALKKRLREMRRELEELKQTNEELDARLAETPGGNAVAARPAETEEGGAEEVDSLDILAADAKVTARNETIWQYTWRLKLANRGERTIRLVGQVLFKDKQGSRVSGSPVDCRVGGGETKTVTGDCTIRSAKAEKVDQLSVTVREIAGE